MKNLVLGLLLMVCCQVGAQEQWVDEVRLEGLKRLKHAYVAALLKTQAGQKLDTLALAEDLLFLKRLPAVANATVISIENAQKGLTVQFTVEENFTLIPTLNIYTTDEDEFAFRIGLGEFDLFGRNIGLGAFYQKDIYASYGLGFKAPFLFGRHWGLGLFFQSLTTQEPVFFNDTTADYRYNNTSLEVSVLHQFDLKHRVELGFSVFNEDYEYLEGGTSPEVPQRLDVNKGLIKGIYEYNALDYFFYYLSGFKGTLNLQYVVSDDSSLPDFALGYNDLCYFDRVGKRGNWASRLRLGLASNIDSPFAPFAVDNNLNLRGVGNTIDRGTAAIVLNTEYRHTLFEKDWFVVQGNAFIDTGTWRDPGGDLGDFGKSENLRVYPGVGVRFMHKRIFNAILRIDYGVGITEGGTQGFVFGIGQYF